MAVSPLLWRKKPMDSISGNLGYTKYNSTVVREQWGHANIEEVLRSIPDAVPFTVVCETFRHEKARHATPELLSSLFPGLYD
jgi:hypothetical protein